MMRVAFGFYLTATVLRVWMATNERFAPIKDAAKPTLSGFKVELTTIFALLLSGGVLTWIWITDAVGDTSYNLIGQLFPIYLSDIGKLNVQQIGIVNAAIGITAIIAAPLAIAVALARVGVGRGHDQRRRDHRGGAQGKHHLTHNRSPMNLVLAA